MQKKTLLDILVYSVSKNLNKNFRNKKYLIDYMTRKKNRAGEPANFLVAPAPDFFFKRAKNTRLRPAQAPQPWRKRKELFFAASIVFVR